MIRIRQGTGYDAVGMEDLYMLEAMYNQASVRRTFSPTPGYVASTINNGTYNGYLAGKDALQGTLWGPADSNQCDHLVSAEATFSEFWDGDLTFSNLNKWYAANLFAKKFGPVPFSYLQIAGTVFWNAARTSVGPQPGFRHPPINLNPVLPVRRGH